MISCIAQKQADNGTSSRGHSSMATTSSPPAADMPAMPAHATSDTLLRKGSAAPTLTCSRTRNPNRRKPAEQAADYAAAPMGGWGVDVAGAKSGKPVYRGGKLLGVSSLKIDIQQPAGDEQVLTFTSLGADPEVVISLADHNQVDSLSWAAGVIAFLCGMAITRGSIRQKIAFVLILGLSSALLPLAWDATNVAAICNAVFYAATLLVPYYLAAGFIRWIARGLTNVRNRLLGRAATTARVLAAMLVGHVRLHTPCPSGAKPHAAAQDAAAAPPPVAVPEDALIIPYDAKLENGIEKADHLLVPYNRYVELWNRAYPDKKLEAHPAPLPYALSGAAYNATLEGDETLNVTGQMQIDVLVDDYVSIPLALRGGVLARATLDGKPAQMKIVNAPLSRREPVAQDQKPSPAAPCRKREWTRRSSSCKSPAKARTSWKWKCV